MRQVGSMAPFYNPIISAEPVFIVRPSSHRVGLNGIAKFDCVAQGNPPPSVFWAKEVKLSILLLCINSISLELARVVAILHLNIQYDCEDV